MFTFSKKNLPLLLLSLLSLVFVPPSALLTEVARAFSFLASVTPLFVTGHVVALGAFVHAWVMGVMSAVLGGGGEGVSLDGSAAGVFFGNIGGYVETGLRDAAATCEGMVVGQVLDGACRVTEGRALNAIEQVSGPGFEGGFPFVPVLAHVMSFILTLPLLFVVGSLVTTASAVYAAVTSASASYILVGAFLYYVASPHSAAFTKPNVNEEKARKADWKQVEWKQKVQAQAPKTGAKYAVIGAGFVGEKLIHTLLMRGETQIKVFDMDPQACDSFKNDLRVEFVRGDVTNYDQVLEAMRGCEIVFTTFALIRYMDRLQSQKSLSFRVNVNGTENVVRACQTLGIQTLVYTSTSNVCVAPGQVSLDMDEKVPYVTMDNTPNWYGISKAVGEEVVLKADGIRGLRTGCIRPSSGVFGADDRHLLDSMLKLGRAPLPPNGGSTVIDFIPCNNVVWGLLLLERALLDKADQGVGGNAFCVSNDAPMRMLDFCELVNIIRPGGVIRIPTPHRLLVAVAYGVEFATYLGFKVPGQLGQFTAATVDYLNMSCAFSSRKARERLGYTPVFSVEQAIKLSVDEYLQGQMLPVLPVLKAVVSTA